MTASAAGPHEVAGDFQVMSLPVKLIRRKPFGSVFNFILRAGKR